MGVDGETVASAKTNNKATASGDPATGKLNLDRPLG